MEKIYNSSYFFASSQFFPTPTSTAIGMSQLTTCSIVLWSILVTSSVSLSGHSTTSSSWTCIMSFASNFCVLNFSWIATIEYLRISAQVHWIGMFMASRFACSRTIEFLSESPLIVLLLPKNVSV